MKRNRLFTALLLMLVTNMFFTSCDGSYKERMAKEKEWEEREKAREEAKKARLQQYADSTVSLSFKGIELGQPFTKTVQYASKKGGIYNVKYDNTRESATCKAKLKLPNTEEDLVVDVKICSFQDTITSFVIMSDKYETHENLEKLYKDKYDTDYAVESSGRRYVWEFKNQSVEVSTHVKEETEVYVKNPQMRSPQNRYGTKTHYIFQATSIIYTDYNQRDKVNAFEAEEAKEKARLAAIENRKRAIADSIKKEQKKKEVESQDI